MIKNKNKDKSVEQFTSHLVDFSDVLKKTKNSFQKYPSQFIYPQKC